MYVCLFVFLCVFSQDLGLSNQDVLLLLYGHASVLTDIGQQEVARLLVPLRRNSSLRVLGSSDIIYGVCLLNAGTCRSKKDSEKDEGV